MEEYLVKIVMRDFQGQTRHDYYATVTRSSDDVELVFISDYRWLLRWKTRRKALERAYNDYEKWERKTSEKEWLVR